MREVSGRHEMVMYFRESPNTMPLEEWNAPSRWWYEGTGWWPLVVEASSFITLHGAAIVQVKEKFGGLRIYVNGGNKEIWDYLRALEDRSLQICEVCGRPGRLRDSRSWWRTLCEEHSGEGTEEAGS